MFQKLLKEEDYEYIKTTIFDEEESSVSRIKDYIKLYEALHIEIEEDDDEETIEYKQLSMKIAKLMSSCTRNMFLIYSSYLQEFLSFNKDSELQRRLLTIKYYNAYTKHDMETILVNSRFRVPKENYVDVYLVAETLGVNIDECDEIIVGSHLSIIYEMISQIMSLNDNSYKDYNKLAVIVNATFMLQAGLSMLNSRDYALNKKEIFKKIEELSTDENQRSTKIVTDTIKSIKEYQKRVRKISMRPYLS